MILLLLNAKYKIVPQGAVVSPILFSIYINDISVNYNKNKDYSLLFADDLSTVYMFKKFSKIEKQINKDLGKLEFWLMRWSLLMESSK